jgi:hypothetical protein
MWSRDDPKPYGTPTPESVSAGRIADDMGHVISIPRMADHQGCRENGRLSETCHIVQRHGRFGGLASPKTLS